MTKHRPFLKWAGNKYQCLEQIISRFPQAKHLVEPFTGSAAIFLNSNFKENTLAEANADLVHLYQCLQQNGEEFINICRPFFSPEFNQPERYYELRNIFNQSEPSAHKSAVFLYLNRHGYNGLCRYNSKGGYNVPFGRYKKPYFPESEMRYFYQKSHKAHIIEMDFRQTLQLARAEDLVYCDPPYVSLSKTASFSHYTPLSFGEKEQIELSVLAEKAVAAGATVIISNHDTDFTREIYAKAEITSFKVNRFISCKANTRLPVKELIAVFKPT